MNCCYCPATEDPVPEEPCDEKGYLCRDTLDPHCCERIGENDAVREGGGACSCRPEFFWAGKDRLVCDSRVHRQGPECLADAAVERQVLPVEHAGQHAAEAENIDERNDTVFGESLVLRWIRHCWSESRLTLYGRLFCRRSGGPSRLGRPFRPAGLHQLLSFYFSLLIRVIVTTPLQNARQDRADLGRAAGHTRGHHRVKAALSMTVLPRLA